MIEIDEMKMNDWGSVGYISELVADRGGFYVCVGSLFSWYVAKVIKRWNMGKRFS